MSFQGFIFKIGIYFGWTKGYAPYEDRTKIFWFGPVGFVWGQDNTDIENWSD